MAIPIVMPDQKPRRRLDRTGTRSRPRRSRRSRWACRRRKGRDWPCGAPCHVPGRDTSVPLRGPAGRRPTNGPDRGAVYLRPPPPPAALARCWHAACNRGRQPSRGAPMPDMPYIADARSVARRDRSDRRHRSAHGAGERGGGSAPIAAGDIGNHIHFCHWRQIERLIVVLGAPCALGYRPLGERFRAVCEQTSIYLLDKIGKPRHGARDGASRSAREGACDADGTVSDGTRPPRPDRRRTGDAGRRRRRRPDPAGTPSAGAHWQAGFDQHACCWMAISAATWMTAMVTGSWSRCMFPAISSICTPFRCAGSITMSRRSAR